MDIKQKIKRLLYLLTGFLTDNSKESMSVKQAREILEERHRDVFSTSIKDVKVENAPVLRKVDLDIIVPCYNVEKYIVDCLFSVINQKTKYKVRIIAVNDGSKDSTESLLNEFQYNYQNEMIVLNQDNEGISAARNKGLSMSNSNYVMFLDADDRLTSEAIDKLLDTAYQHNADIVEGAYNVIINDTQIKIGNTHKTGQVDPLFYFEGFPWGKVIKKNIFDLVEFPKGYSYEDSVLKHIVYPLADKSYGIDDVVYLYRQNNEGVSKKLKYQYKSIDSLYIALSLYSDRKKLGIDDTQEYYEYILRNVVLTFKRTALLEKKVRRAIFVIYADFINNCFCEYVTNRNRVLEDIIKTKNYKKYEIWCRLN